MLEQMLPAGFILILLMLVGFSCIGIAHILRPQVMFKVYHSPIGASGDYLTENGIRAYKRRGYGIFGIAIILLFTFLYLYFVKY